ncbi:trimethylamine-N-oxide reductase precursor [Escherichia coli]|uniref:Trimethylamine-N-oxide reductase n=1 Tax=Escherichia coli TaxID=562 RepID=A0A2X1N0A3_ECOLX|nr:trimethylamine-N-oxide reductase precursor [Escherichia coli]
MKHIAVNPQTDVPLQLALAHTLYSETCTTKTSLLTTVWVFEQFLPYLWVRKTVSRKMPHGLKN